MDCALVPLRESDSYLAIGIPGGTMTGTGNKVQAWQRLLMRSAAIGLSIALLAPITARADGERYSAGSYKDAPGAYTEVLGRPYIFYVGGAIGEYWLNSEHRHQALGNWTQPGNEAVKAYLDQTGSAKINGSDTTVSAFFGLDYRHSAWLLGIEFDANYLGFQRRTEVAPGPVTIGGVAGVADFFNSARIAHMETLRARIGYTFNHTTLFMTAGLAVAEVDFNQSINFPFSSASYADGRHLQAGWVVGGGLERQLSRDVSLRAEYLYADLGRLTKNYTNNCPNNVPLPASCGNAGYAPGFDHRVSYDVTTQIARVGLKVAMSEFGGGSAEPYKAGAVPGSYVDYASMKTDFSGLYISPIGGSISGRTTFALSRFNSGYGVFPNPLFVDPTKNDTAHKVDLSGFVFGGVLGYQKQFGNIVVGADVSLQGSAGAGGKADCTPTGQTVTSVTAECTSRLYDGVQNPRWLRDG